MKIGLMRLVETLYCGCRWLRTVQGAGLQAVVMVLTLWLGLALPAHSQASADSAVAAAPEARDVVTDYRLPPDKLAKAEALYRTRIAVFVVGSLYAVAVLLLVLELGLARRFRELAERVSGRRWVQVLVFAPLILLSIDVLSLPLGIYSHRLQLDYGLSVQSWGSWLGDWGTGELITTVIGTLLIWGLYALVRRSPRRWWLYAWLAVIPFILLVVLLHPIFIAPLFDKFDSLQVKQPRLLEQLERVTQRGGLTIERERMFEMRASDKVTTYNAYVTGIGASKRVVVWDNTARELSIAETMFVFGHEQGHYVLQHVWISLGFAIVGLLLGFYLAHRAIGLVLLRFGGRWGIRGLEDWASFPALFLLLNLFGWVGQPIAAGFSRHLEHQADIYGLEVIHGLVPDSSQAAAHAFQKLGEKSLVYPKPHPLYVFWAFDHPPLHERIEFAVKYQPWTQGVNGRYFN